MFLENETDAYNPDKCCVQNKHSSTIPYLLYREQGWVDDTLLDQWQIINVTNLSIHLSIDAPQMTLFDTKQTFKATNSNIRNSAARSILSHDKPNQSRDSHGGEGAQQLRASLVTWPKRATTQQFNTIWWATVPDPRIFRKSLFSSPPHHFDRYKYKAPSWNYDVMCFCNTSCSQHISRLAGIGLVRLTKPINTLICYYSPTTTA